MGTEKWGCTVRDGKFLEPCDGIRQCLQGSNPTPRDKPGLYLVTYAKAIPFTPTRTFAVLKSGEHQRAGIVLNMCPFCGERIDEMCRDVDEKETPEHTERGRLGCPECQS